MKISRNPPSLKVRRGGGIDFMCPNCQSRFLYEAQLGELNVHCPDCGHRWRVGDSGKPKATS